MAEIPRAARLKGLPDLDTAYGYHFDLEVAPEGNKPSLDVDPRPQ